MNYRLFGRSAMRVSELCLGTMTFGNDWGTGSDYETSKKVFDAYANAGGNFIDTANRYTEGTSETYLGDFLAADRDHFVVATKYTLYTRMGDPNFAGNHRKNMVRALDESLKRLKTDHIDIYWVHAWDDTMQPDELMRSLEYLVSSGKVLHIGISDTPAWIVSCCNSIAELRGWSPFVGLQLEYSLVNRDAERELLPMAQAFGLTVTPWSPLGAGVLSGKYLQSKAIEGARLKPESVRLTDRNMSIAQAVADVALEIGVSSAQVALAFLRQHHPGVIPIVGARTEQQLVDNLGCIQVVLSADQLQRLRDVSSVVLGWPHDFLAGENIQNLMFGGTRSKIR
ncbi:MAG TPA: aldo/keto reductase [Candidatus Didemnitutus sp.]|nr:aldo/keto reductase [Candidatus Didemnitutus sp.]